MDKKDFIGIFDSGIGGISVLKHAVTELILASLQEGQGAVR